MSHLSIGGHPNRHAPKFETRPLASILRLPTTRSRRSGTEALGERSVESKHSAQATERKRSAGPWQLPKSQSLMELLSLGGPTHEARCRIEWGQCAKRTDPHREFVVCVGSLIHIDSLDQICLERWSVLLPSLLIPYLLILIIMQCKYVSPCISCQQQVLRLHVTVEELRVPQEPQRQKKLPPKVAHGGEQRQSTTCLGR